MTAHLRVVERRLTLSLFLCACLVLFVEALGRRVVVSASCCVVRYSLLKGDEKIHGWQLCVLEEKTANPKRKSSTIGGRRLRSYFHHVSSEVSVVEG